MGILRYAGGKLSMVAPVAGIQASDLAIGSSVYLMENGVAVEYLVVNQGIPSGSSLYDASCDGTWLLRKNHLEKRTWGSSYDYSAGNNHNYLNRTFFNKMGSIEQATIKQVKIPYCKGTGVNGLSAKVFLLSMKEVFGSRNCKYTDGAQLSYFSDGPDTNMNDYSGSSDWWTRTPYDSSTYAYYIGYGSYGKYSASELIRPACVVPKTALFDEDDLILKGVA